jgi:hypothetical protein
MPSLKNIKCYSKDGRKSIFDLYSRFDRLVDYYGWIKEVIDVHNLTMGGEKYSLPSSVYLTKTEGPSVWLISGIHGEEPAGPNAVFDSVDFLGELSKKDIPLVIMPLCNPSGYVRNWRYPNEYRDEKRGHSLGDSGYLLLDNKNRRRPRTNRSSSNEAKILTGTVLRMFSRYPPQIAIDLHEDEDISNAYIYSQGKLGVQDPVAKKIINIIEASKMPLEGSGKTRFGEKIEGGIIFDVHDSSIDELLSAEKIFINGKISKGPGAPSVIVVETPIKGVKLARRVKIHKSILASLEKLQTLSL